MPKNKHGSNPRRLEENRNGKYKHNTEPIESSKDNQEKMLEELLKYDPNNGEVLNELGILEYEKGEKRDLGLALKYLLRADKLK